MYGILAQVVEHLTFNQVVRGSNPRCLIRNYVKRWFGIRTTDNVVDRGARRPVDVCLARTEAERRTNPRCLIYIFFISVLLFRGVAQLG